MYCGAFSAALVLLSSLSLARAIEKAKVTYCTIVIGDHASEKIRDDQLKMQPICSEEDHSGRPLGFLESMEIVEIDVQADDGMPSVLIGVIHPRDKRRSLLATAVGDAVFSGVHGALACSNSDGRVGLSGVRCVPTLRAFDVAKGDILMLLDGVADGARQINIALVMRAKSKK